MHKAKDLRSWDVWRYGKVDGNASVMQTSEGIVDVIPTTVCEDTGLLCKHVKVYEGDWLKVDALGEERRYLVVRAGDGFEVRGDDGEFSIRNLLRQPSCRIDGNIFD